VTSTVSIHILDKEYQVNCPPEEQSALIQSSQVLDKRMREIRKSGNVIGLERIAIMAALNLTYDMLKAESKATTSEALDKDLQRMDSKITEALDKLSQPEL
jgi:cell division protein ZapA